MSPRIVVPSLASLLAACTPWGLESADGPETWPSQDEPSPETEPDSGPVQPTAAARTPALTVELIPRFDKVLAGTSGEMDVLVRMTGAEVPNAPSPPLDLALVLDRSGSMDGPKLAAVQVAAVTTVDQLDGDDRLTFIAYDDRVDLHASRIVPDADQRRQLRGAIEQLYAGGGTALGPALAKGIDELEGKERSDETLAHIILLSDGLANQGESNPEVLAHWAAKAYAQGVAISTLGVGVDYNEDLMTRIADAGGGRYHFIEKSKDVPKVVADEFAGLSSTVARGITLQVDPPSGISADDIYGYPVERTGNVLEAKVGSVSSGQKRELLAHLHYEATTGSELALGTFTVQYRDALADGALRTLEFHPVLAVSQDQAEVAASEHAEVRLRATEFQVATAMEQASRHIEQGEYEQARKLLKKHGKELELMYEEDPSPELEGLVHEMDEAADDIDRAKENQYERQKYLKGYKSKAYKKKKK